MSIEEVEVGAVDSDGDPLFGLIPRVVGGAPMSTESYPNNERVPIPARSLEETP